MIGRESLPKYWDPARLANLLWLVGAALIRVAWRAWVLLTPWSTGILLVLVSWQKKHCMEQIDQCITTKIDAIELPIAYIPIITQKRQIALHSRRSYLNHKKWHRGRHIFCHFSLLRSYCNYLMARFISGNTDNHAQMQKSLPILDSALLYSLASEIFITLLNCIVPWMTAAYHC